MYKHTYSYITRTYILVKKKVIVIIIIVLTIKVYNNISIRLLISLGENIDRKIEITTRTYKSWTTAAAVIKCLT